ncbi:hybrid sensor histidine kinase/response regulator [soil metagenome]
MVSIAQDLPAAAPAGARLLIVDDDPRVRRTFSTAMQRVGLHVFTAEDAASAIKLAMQTPPDLVLVDYNMAVLGTEVVRALKAQYGTAVWIAVISGHDDAATRAICFDAGADDVIGKPVNLSELRRRVVAVARMQQAHVENRLAREHADRLIAYGAEASAMLAHDLNNGLALALANMTFLQDVVELGDDESSALSATIHAVRRMSGLVANLVDISRFEDASVRPALESVKVRGLIDDVLGVHGGDRKLTYVNDTPADLAAMFDAALVERVLHNLVGNAVRYCADGGKITVVAEQHDDASVSIHVINDGPLITSEMRERLFAKYAKCAGGKRGFGLYFCRLACEAHGGTIEYAPIGERSRFSIRLPGR